MSNIRHGGRVICDSAIQRGEDNRGNSREPVQYISTLSSSANRRFSAWSNNLSPNPNCRLLTDSPEMNTLIYADAHMGHDVLYGESLEFWSIIKVVKEKLGGFA